MTSEIFMKMFREALEKEGREVADKFNKLALESGVIDITTYSRAARILVADYLKEARE